MLNAGAETLDKVVVRITSSTKRSNLYENVALPPIIELERSGAFF
jgi:hypothetical protein